MSAVVIVGGMFAYTWVASRLVKMPSAGVSTAAGRQAERRAGARAGAESPTPESEPLVDSLLRDLDAALHDRGMVRDARRRVQLSRRSHPPRPGS